MGDGTRYATCPICREPILTPDDARLLPFAGDLVHASCYDEPAPGPGTQGRVTEFAR